MRPSRSSAIATVSADRSSIGQSGQAHGTLRPADPNSGAPDALAGAVVDMLADEPLRQRRGAAGRELVQQRYAWEHVAGQLLEIYEDVVDRVPANA